MVDEQKIIQEHSEEKKSILEKTIKIGATIIGVALIIILIVIKINTPDFSLIWVFILSCLFAFIVAGLWIGYGLYHKYATAQEIIAREKRLPDPITVEEAKAYAQELTKVKEFAELIPYADNIKQYLVGKSIQSQIFQYDAHGIYTGQPITILINMHYPAEKHAVLFQPPKSAIPKIAESLGVERDEKPNKRVVKRESPLTGIKEEEVEEIYHHEEKENKKQKGELD